MKKLEGYDHATFRRETPDWYTAFLDSLARLMGIMAVGTGLMSLFSAFVWSSDNVAYAIMGIVSVPFGVALIVAKPASRFSKWMESRLRAADDASRRLTEDLRASHDAKDQESKSA